MERNDFIEKVFGGILGSIAIIAIVVEMILGDFSPEAICGGIKDIASTAIVIILLIAFANEHRKTKGLCGSIEHAMTKLEKGYSPLIRQATASETSGEAKKNKLNRIFAATLVKYNMFVTVRKRYQFQSVLTVLCAPQITVSKYFQNLFRNVIDCGKHYTMIEYFVRDLNLYQEIYLEQIMELNGAVLYM